MAEQTFPVSRQKIRTNYKPPSPQPPTCAFGCVTKWNKSLHNPSHRLSNIFSQAPEQTLRAFLPMNAISTPTPPHPFTDHDELRWRLSRLSMGHEGGGGGEPGQWSKLKPVSHTQPLSQTPHNPSQYRAPCVWLLLAQKILNMPFSTQRHSLALFNPKLLLNTWPTQFVGSSNAELSPVPNSRWLPITLNKNL